MKTSCNRSRKAWCHIKNLSSKTCHSKYKCKYRYKYKCKCKHKYKYVRKCTSVWPLPVASKTDALHSCGSHAAAGQRNPGLGFGLGLDWVGFGLVWWGLILVRDWVQVGFEIGVGVKRLRLDFAWTQIVKVSILDEMAGIVAFTCRQVSI